LAISTQDLHPTWQLGDPDAILLMNFAFLTYVLLLLDPRFWKVLIIFRGDSHNLNRTPSLKDRISRLCRNLLFRRFSVFLVVGKANYHYYRDAGAPAFKLFTGLHAVDNARFIDAEKQSLSRLQNPGKTSVLIGSP
jgi:hypothetical protein